jgi:hypothetical protein
MHFPIAAFRPTGADKAAVCHARNPSTPVKPIGLWSSARESRDMPRNISRLSFVVARQH